MEEGVGREKVKGGSGGGREAWGGKGEWRREGVEVVEEGVEEGESGGGRKGVRKGK